MNDNIDRIKDVVENIYDKLSQNKKQISLNFIMTNSYERIPIEPSILCNDTCFLGLHNLSVYNSVYNVSEKNNKMKIEVEAEESIGPLPKVTKNKIIYVDPGAYEFSDLKKIILKNTSGNVSIEADHKTLRALMKTKIKVDFNVQDSIAGIFGFEKKVYDVGEHKSERTIQINPFETVNLHCNCIEGYLQNGRPTDILYTFRLNVPVGYKINETPQHVMYKKVIDDRIDYMDFSVKDENDIEIDFNGEKLCFTLELKN